MCECEIDLAFFDEASWVETTLIKEVIGPVVKVVM